MAGNRVLEERFASPKLDSFSQRVVARCYLESLNRTETQDYIHALIAAAGGKGPRLFPAESCNSVYKATDGVPRLINQVCDHALLLAYAGGKRQVEPGLVEEAWADLQQLPTPWNEQSDPDRNIIEFGGLDDEPAEATQAAASEQAAADADAQPSTPLRSTSCRTSNTKPRWPTWSRPSSSSRSSRCWRTWNRSFARPARSVPRSSWFSTSRSIPSASRFKKRK